MLGFVIASLLLLIATPALSQSLLIVHKNIGQGDATLILWPPDSSGNRVTVLVDSGDIRSGSDPDGGAIILDELANRRITTIDFFIATHYDADHVGGVATGTPHIHWSSFVLGPDGTPGNAGDDDGDGAADWLDTNMTKPDPEELGTGDDIKVLTYVDRGDTNHPTSSQTYDKYIAIANVMGQRRSLVTQNDVDTFQIDLGSGAVMTSLSANGFVRNRSTPVPNVNTENERSLSFILSFGGFQYLIGGDLIGRQHGNENAEVERAVGQFLQANNVNVDVLHVNHHGANNASETDFLTAVSPEVAVISLGNGNSHGHPHVGVLNRLSQAGVRAVFQTNWGTTAAMIPSAVRNIQAIVQGDIVLTTDGQTYQITTSRTFTSDA